MTYPKLVSNIQLGVPLYCPICLLIKCDITYPKLVSNKQLGVPLYCPIRFSSTRLSCRFASSFFRSAVLLVVADIVTGTPS